MFGMTDVCVWFVSALEEEGCVGWLAVTPLLLSFQGGRWGASSRGGLAANAHALSTRQGTGQWILLAV